jgi:lysophospholipase L1-like esterase
MNPTRLTRLTRWLLAVLLIGAISAACYHFHFRRPVGSGPAGPSVPAVVRPWTSRPVVLLGVGDSVTAGFGARKGYSYVDRLADNPPDEFPDLRGQCLRAVLPQLQVMNRSVSGSTSLDHWTKQLPKLPQFDTNTLGIVVLTTGGNDLIHHYGKTAPQEGAMYGTTLEQAQPWIQNFELRLKFMLDHLTNRFPGGCHIFLANIYDPTDGVGDMERAGLPRWPDGLKLLEAYNEIIQRTAAKRPQVHLIDLHTTFLGHGIHCTQPWNPHYSKSDPHYWYHDNLEDPNERGYDAIRRLFLTKIVKALGPD